MDYSTPSFPVLHYESLLRLTSIELMMPSNHLILSPPSPPALNLFQHQGLFQWVGSSSDGWSVGIFASASVLPMDIQVWFPLGFTGLMSLLSKGLSSIFTSTRVWKHQFFDAQPSLWSNSHIPPYKAKIIIIWLFTRSTWTPGTERYKWAVLQYIRVMGTSLVVQWLRLICTPNARGLG